MSERIPLTRLMAESTENPIFNIRGENSEMPRQGNSYMSLKNCTNTSEDDEQRLLAGMSSDAASFDCKRVLDRSQGTTRPFASEEEGVNGIHADDYQIGGASNISGQQYDDFHTIDWVRDLSRDRLRHRSLQKRHPGQSPILRQLTISWDALTAWLCVFLIGVFTAVVASIIDIGAGWMSDLRFGICPGAPWFNQEQCCWATNATLHSLDDCDEWYYWSEVVGFSSIYSFQSHFVNFICYVVLAVVFAFFGAMLVRVFAPYACGSGIPEIKTILSGFIIKGYLGFWTLLIKSCSMMLAVSAGLSLGKEGPLVHIAACCGNLFVRLFPKYGRNEAKKREILSAACAAGVSVAFGAPMGGILFSLEEASYYFPLKTLWRSFLCALVAAFVLQTINPLGTDHAVLFYVEYNAPWYMFELVPFVILGALGGIMGNLFIRFNIAWCRYRRKSILGHYPITEVVSVSLITAVFGYMTIYSRMPTSKLISLLFRNCAQTDTSPICDYRHPVETESKVQQSPHRYIGAEAGDGMYGALFQLSIALVLKSIMTVFTFGLKIPAGLFIPSMAVGAICGRIMGVLLEQFAFYHPDMWPFNQYCNAFEISVSLC